MVDFKSAIQAGIQAHEVAEVARREIREVVLDLASQVADWTSNALSVDFSQGTRQSLKQLAGHLAGLMAPEVTHVTYANLILIRLIEPKESAEICEVEISPGGYPVLVAGPGKRENCYDRASFEVALQELFKHPDTGNKIKRLMDVAAELKQP